MQKNSTSAEAAPLFAGEAWFDPIEAALRERVRLFLEEVIEQEAAAASEGRRRVTGTARARGGGWAHSDRSRSQSPGPGCWLRMGRAGSVRARCCPAMPG